MKGFCKVSKEDFDLFIKKQAVIEEHTYKICEPSVTFYWNDLSINDRSYGNGAIAARYNDYEVGNPDNKKPEFYIKNDVINSYLITNKRYL